MFKITLQLLEKTNNRFCDCAFPFSQFSLREAFTLFFNEGFPNEKVIECSKWMQDFIYWFKGEIKLSDNFVKMMFSGQFIWICSKDHGHSNNIGKCLYLKLVRKTLMIFHFLLASSWVRVSGPAWPSLNLFDIPKLMTQWLSALMSF